ncbi:hypothetical protein HAX54_037637 [Datura stramonium]|uniref:sucrose-phosphate synthase n=1 Tax=Datura stramonium TaxID=4076 RepID=A0ABS8VII2_DATST|nr:hypothetical protein [Datura stramonium]
MSVIPPGMDFSNVVVQEETADADGDLAALTNADGQSPKVVPTIWSEVMRFLINPHKPMILALSRPDPKKNITTLVKAFGECRPLRELANLTLIMGNRDDIDEMSAGNASVLTTAAAHGLPMVATKNGGPVDIHRALNNGLFRPHDQQAIADALLKLVSEKNLRSKAVKSDSQIARVSGFAISTAMSMSELTAFLGPGNIKLTEFDALICSSGSEVFYPGTCTEEHAKLYPDADYSSQG